MITNDDARLLEKTANYICTQHPAEINPHEMQRLRHLAAFIRSINADPVLSNLVNEVLDFEHGGRN